MDRTEVEADWRSLAMDCNGENAFIGIRSAMVELFYSGLLMWAVRFDQEGRPPVAGGWR